MNKSIVLILTFLCFILIACGGGSDKEKEVVQPPVVISPIAKDWRLISVKPITSNSAALRVTDITGTIILLDVNDSFTNVGDGLFLFNANALKEAIKVNKLSDDDLLKVTAEDAAPYDMLTSLFTYSDIKNNEKVIFVNILSSFLFDYLNVNNALMIDKINDEFQRLFLGFNFQDLNGDNVTDYRDIMMHDSYYDNTDLFFIVNDIYGSAKASNTGVELSINLVIENMQNNLDNTPFSLFSNNGSSAEIYLENTSETQQDAPSYHIASFCSGLAIIEEKFIKEEEYITLNDGCGFEYRACWYENIDECGDINYLYFYNGEVNTAPEALFEETFQKSISSTVNKIKIVKLKESTEFMAKLDNIINVTDAEEIVTKFKVCQLFREYDAYCEL